MISAVVGQHACEREQYSAEADCATNNNAASRAAIFNIVGRVVVRPRRLCRVLSQSIRRRQRSGHRSTYFIRIAGLSVRPINIDALTVCAADTLRTYSFSRPESTFGRWNTSAADLLLSRLVSPLDIAFIRRSRVRLLSFVSATHRRGWFGKKIKKKKIKMKLAMTFRYDHTLTHHTRRPLVY